MGKPFFQKVKVSFFVDAFQNQGCVTGFTHIDDQSFSTSCNFNNWYMNDGPPVIDS